MWRNIFKGAFYVLFVLCLLAVAAGAVICVIYGVQQKDNLYYLYGAGVLAGGILIVLVLFSFTGMIIEACDNLAAMKKEVCDNRVRRSSNVTYTTQRPAANGQQRAYQAPNAYPQQAPVQPSVQYVPNAVQQNSAAQVNMTAPEAPTEVPERAMDPSNWS